MRTAQLIVLLSLAGCASKDLAARIEDERCFSADDCGAGFICLSGQCVNNNAVGPDDIYVEIAPPSGSPYAPAQVLNAVATGGVLNLQVPTPTEFEVRVLQGTDPISATIAVFGDRRIPDREVDLTQTLNRSGSVLRLTPGAYAVRLIPDDRRLPGFEASDFMVRNSDVRQTKEFVVPETYRTLSGAVVSSVAASSTIAGAIVRAIGERTGLPSTDSISGVGGRYSLDLPSTSETQFRLTAMVTDPAGPSWSFEQLVKVEGSGREKRIELEKTNPMLRGRVKLKILGSGGPAGPEPIADAVVTLTATTAVRGLDTRTYRILGTTGPDGMVIMSDGNTATNELPILAERYLVDVRTSQRSPYSSTVRVLDLSDAQGILLTEQVTLDLRTQVTGAVLSASSRGVSDALIELVPFDDRGRTIDARTESDGTFVAAVDPGAYLMVIRPPRSSNGELLPAHTEEVEVGADLRVDLLPITLPAGIEITGTVKGENAGPIAGARVEFFVRRADRTISIARTITDAGGLYSVILAN